MVPVNLFGKVKNIIKIQYKRGFQGNQVLNFIRLKN